MTALLGVSRNLTYLNDKPGQVNYWCYNPKVHQVQEGDIVLLYIPVSVSQSKCGIAQIYTITGFPNKRHSSQCYEYGLLQLDTCLVLNLNNHITFKDMKADPVVSQWGALGRNFQGVTFKVDRSIWPRLRGMIISRNPEAESALPAGNLDDDQTTAG